MADSQVLKALLHDNPLCGIGTYKDELNLATGVCTRQIKKLIFTGGVDENWGEQYVGENRHLFRIKPNPQHIKTMEEKCTHFLYGTTSSTTETVTFDIAETGWFRFRPDNASNVSLSDWRTWLSAQYTAGTPVTVWYVLETPTTETITVPSGLSGTEEGYLNQSDTPTPTNPIYPTANEVEIWQHSLRKLGTSTDTLTTLPVDIYADGNNATVGISGNTVQSGTPTPDNPIMPQGCGDLETVGVKSGQYKIPISSASTATPVYLGEVDTTRKIKKLVLMGEENITMYTVAAGNLFRIELPALRILGHFADNGICTHYRPVVKSADRVNGTISGGNVSIVQGVVDIVDDYTTVDDFKAYLAQQYANGAPVTVWYVLANETTGIVNEPLMKIGDYADTVSGITVPTITGKDTFDVETTLKPSEVTVSYTGWHAATVEEWDGSQWNQ